jgi:hypothetical protein
MRTFITALAATTLLLTAPCLAAGSAKTGDSVAASTVSATPSKDDSRDQIKAKYKDQWDKLKLSQKDQRDKLRADQKDQRDKLKAEQKQQRDKLRLAERDQLRKFDDQPAEVDDTPATRGKKTGAATLR